MKVLITGGAGFIGSHLADKLIKRKDKVYIIDNFATGREDNIPKEAKLFNMSIVDTSEVAITIGIIKPDIIIHAAASYKDPEDWYTDSLTNTFGTTNILRACKSSGCKRIIYFQTSLCYGDPLTSPITLKHPIRPSNSYSISKTAAEQYIALSGLDFVSFRLANCYGPRNLSGPVPTFYQRLTEGKQCFVVNTRRDFVFIDDLVEIVMKAIDGKGKGYYHISTGKDFSIRELYDNVSNVLDMDVKAEERERGKDDVETILLDPGKTTDEFGFLPKTPLLDGVRAATIWYRSNPVSETFTHLKMK